MTILKTVFCLLVVCFISCKEAPERPDAILDENYQPSEIQGAPNNATTAVPPATPNTPEPAQNADGVWHYTCPSGCAGGGAGATACATCGTTLVHNQLYHNNNAAATTPITPTGAPSTTPPAPATPEPAQNAAGVWHYTCSNGCAGGAGSAIACSSCGNLLAHNPIYHQ